MDRPLERLVVSAVLHAPPRRLPDRGGRRAALLVLSQPGRARQPPSEERGVRPPAAHHPHARCGLLQRTRSSIPPPSRCSTGRTFAVGLLALAGLFTRVSLFLFATGTWIFVAHLFSYGDRHHTEALFAIFLMLLALAPSGERLSVDAVIRRRRTGKPRGGDFRAGDLAAQADALVLLGFSYLSAGMAKMTHSGLRWMNGYTLQGHTSGRRPLPRAIRSGCGWRSSTRWRWSCRSSRSSSSSFFWTSLVVPRRWLPSVSAGGADVSGGSVRLGRVRLLPAHGPAGAAAVLPGPGVVASGWCTRRGRSGERRWSAASARRVAMDSDGAAPLHRRDLLRSSRGRGGGADAAPPACGVLAWRCGRELHQRGSGPGTPGPLERHPPGRAADPAEGSARPRGRSRR